ncbi:MAG: M14 family metallopeptidase [Pseudoxanthomonas sp.]
MRTTAACLLLALALPVSAADLTTQAERSGFVETGRYDETIALCDAFAKTWPKAVRCFDFGVTPEGRPMKALAVSTGGALTAQAARERGLPVTLVQGGIHAGEIDGKDAGFWLLRDLLEGKAAPGVLDRQVWLFVPVFNVDGHERFGAWNRPNQRGPKEMGWRTTAQGYNLNRDYTKADAPEMQAMLRLVDEWDPLAEVDLHVTDGAQFEHDVSVTGEPVHEGDDALRTAGRAFKQGIIDALARQGSLPLGFYPSLAEDDNPAAGFADEVYPPRFSHGYFPQRNRFGWLIETHSWKDYPTRVRVTRNAILAVLEQVAAHGRQWRELEREADARAAAGRLGGQSVPLAFAASDKARTIDFRGYAYTRTPSEVSGALMTRYDESRPQIWKVPLHDDLQPSVSVVAPRAGYVVPAAHARRFGEKLKLHGIEFRRIGAQPAAAVQTFRADAADFSARPVEGHQRLAAKGEWKAETRAIADGSLFVPIAQAKARLVMALLEPQASDSLLQWGEFNNAFERKEYMEGYVAEAVAREMLAKDPALKAEFEDRLRDDPKFAASPRARLEFFQRLHPSWDERYNLYPVLRTDAPL